MLASMRRSLLNRSIGHRARLASWLLGAHAGITYAQEGEDRILSRLLDGQNSGFYVDVGAHDPRRFSNTYLLYLAGWSGIAIDPNPAAAEAFRQIRPRDEFVTAAVGPSPGMREYYEFDDPALNTLSRDRADEIVAKTSYRLMRTSVVPVERLDHILDRRMSSSTGIDVMSVDTEGLDEDVLKTNDWQRHRPSLVVAEVLHARTVREADSSGVGRFLSTNGYIPIAKAANSVIFRDTASPGW
jgi:FkbM family methyltransferase